MAFCVGPGELRYSEGGTGCVPMPHGRIAARSVVTEGREHVIFRERPREEHRRVLPFFEIEKGLIEFLQREQMANKPDSGNVILSGPAQDARAGAAVVRPRNSPCKPLGRSSGHLFTGAGYRSWRTSRRNR